MTQRRRDDRTFFDRVHRMLVTRDGDDKFRGPGEILESILPKYPIPCDAALCANKEKYIAMQRSINSSLVNYGYSERMPPCIKCHPKVLWYCQEEELECWRFSGYCNGERVEY
jgi:hypothetical protein